ncbi:MAG: hypothetical protein FJ010_03425 [Chloroflexi bacterium]|nr:hypothetical protein [Chloroflexota bacterium]
MSTSPRKFSVMISITGSFLVLACLLLPSNNIPTSIPPTQIATPTQTPIPSTATDLPPTDSPGPTSTLSLFVRFAVIGDYGLVGQPAQDVSNLIKSWQPDFIITTGDNTYPDGSRETSDENIGQYYHQYIYPYGNCSAIERISPKKGCAKGATPPSHTLFSGTSPFG